jgi:vanadium chloroperoxidase
MTFPQWSVDESIIGLFWGYDGAFQIGTPPRLYNQIIRLVAQKQKNTVAANARLFAFVNVAMADAGILAWDQKYKYEFWRPVVAMREHDTSMGPAATQASDDISDDCDPLWLPYGAPNSNRIGKNFSVYRVRTQAQISARLALDMWREAQAEGRQQTLALLHRARGG